MDIAKPFFVRLFRPLALLRSCRAAMASPRALVLLLVASVLAPR
jgi:hypothetical protein